MRLSEAIRIGSTVTRHVRCIYYEVTTDKNTIIGTCALGAAMVGLSASLDRREMRRIAELYIPAPCPDCPIDSDSIIDHLNDAHDWTREEIADWLARTGLDREIESKAEKTREESLVTV